MLTYRLCALTVVNHEQLHCMAITTHACFHVYGCRYDFARRDSKVVSTTLHWHAHAVADICFTTDGQSETRMKGFDKLATVVSVVLL